MTSAWLWFALLATTPPPAPVFQGEVALPVELFTPAGVRLEANKYQVEIRQEHGDFCLAFTQSQKAADCMPGHAPAEASALTVPLVGAVLLWPVESNEKSEPKSKLSPYLTNISWRAVLRIYRSNKTSDSAVRALLRVGEKTLEFPLYLEKPAPQPPPR